MPRPVKCRKVCHFPNVLEFLPADDTEKKTPIVLTVDEYETIRLLDKKGYSQEQCAVSMQDRKNDGPADLRDCPEENSRCTY